MSKIGCKCGHIIGDHSDNIPYKGHLLPDVRTGAFFAWVEEETQSYVEAAQAGRVGQWLLERGYGQDYVDLKLSHGEVLEGHIYGRFCMFTRDMYECETCGRILMQSRDDNRFLSYVPDNGKVNAILAAVPVD
jgi:hypothetical protein